MNETIGKGEWWVNTNKSASVPTEASVEEYILWNYKNAALMFLADPDRFLSFSITDWKVENLQYSLWQEDGDPIEYTEEDKHEKIMDFFKDVVIVTASEQTVDNFQQEVE